MKEVEQKIEKKRRLGMSGKLILSLGLIAISLLLSVTLAVIEYRRIEVIDARFYRTVMPVFISLGVGLLLLGLLLFYLLTYYVRPINRMCNGLSSYRAYGKKYNIEFDGDDQLSEINTGIRELAEENTQLRARIARLKTRQQQALAKTDNPQE